MRFGLRKLTLLDFPGKTACTVFNAGCNFACPFCHNASLVRVTDELPFSFDEVVSFFKKRTGILDGVCFTGGEPLLFAETLELMKQAKELGFQVKLDTNGSFPEKLKAAVEAKLVDYVAMDIKSSVANYGKVSGNQTCVDKVCESVEYLKSNVVEFEFRTTVTGNLHTVEEFAEIGKWIAPAKRYFLQAFEDSGDVLDKANAGMFAVSDDMLAAALEAVRAYIPTAKIRGR